MPGQHWSKRGQHEAARKVPEREDDFGTVEPHHLRVVGAAKSTLSGTASNEQQPDEFGAWQWKRLHLGGKSPACQAPVKSKTGAVLSAPGCGK